MKFIVATLLATVGLAAAHSSVEGIIIDGTDYPPRFGNVNSGIKAKRIEWRQKTAAGNGLVPAQSVKSLSLACKEGAVPPELNAVARAGAEVRITWTPIVRGHAGPVSNYLGRLESPNQNPNTIKFFKISEKSYDAKTGFWGNEQVLLNNFTDTFQLPSDIKSGIYVLRTELLALHGNAWKKSGFGGPQFYMHCFNVDIESNGTAAPEGHTIPGPEWKDDISTNFDVWNHPEELSKYHTPGPQIYQGKYEQPTGSPRVVKEAGWLPPELEAESKILNQRFKEVKAVYMREVNDVSPEDGKGKSLQKRPSPEEAQKISADARAAYAKMPGLLTEIAIFQKKANAVLAKTSAA